MASPSATSILNSVRQIVQALRVSSRQAESQFGLSSAQLFVLQKLAEADRPVSLSDLAAKTLTHISSVSVVVSRLGDQGLISKQPAPDDARRSEIKVTAKGLKILRERPHTAQEELIAAVGRLQDDEQSQLARLLEKLVDEAKFSSVGSPMFFEDGAKNKDGP
jgi:DNA-binding MarR family transcriptional regulator